MNPRIGIAVLSIFFAITLVDCAQANKNPAGGTSAQASGSGGGGARQGGGGGYGGGGGFGGGGFGGAGGAGRTIVVQMQTANFGPLVVARQVAGTVNPEVQSSVAALISGVVSRVLHKAGDFVRNQETVVQLDDTQTALAVKTAQAGVANAKINLAVGQDTSTQAGPKLQLQVDSAQTALNVAQKAYDSAQALLTQGSASATDVENAKGQLQVAQANLEAAKTNLDQNKNAGTQSLAQLSIAVDQANAQLEQARLNLQQTSIKAPFDGQLAAVNVTLGEFVGQNTSAFVVVSSTKEIDFSVSPGDAASFKLGGAIQFIYSGKTYAATISRSPSAPMNGVVPLAARLTRPGDIPYGAVGSVNYQTTIATGVQVPIAALQSNENQYFVFVVKNGKAATQTVNIIAESGTVAAVSGIDPGTQIIVNPPPGLLEGSAVSGGSAGTDASGQAGQGGAPAGQGGQAGAAGKSPGTGAGANGRTNRQGGQGQNRGQQQGSQGQQAPAALNQTGQS